MALPTPHDMGPSAIRAALFGLCPDCGARTLFAGITRFANDCHGCGLKFSNYNVGDGPAAFLIMIVGTLMVAGAAVLQVAVSPPWWVHVTIWLPLTVGLTLGLLRLAKAVLLIIEHRKQAHEGRIAP